ncbi:zinc-binding dehydrogenase [Streptomyces afghaniensis]|uniref:zinc-binding dehydrogenase n=1 Tax=Streptomyces afghaniensis TaxID=66865 RepID=UPI002787B767|nr:zinc-binding dehydrogenase [Streptomyces afghaniensis]MDQ1016521.1 NADPH:quinone reductase-like Zn-dependent oxidoreductase [Streptomyces afghaniensis]
MTAQAPGPVEPTSSGAPAAGPEAGGANAFVRMTGTGDPERHITPGTGERPVAGRGKVVVRVEAAGVSYAEVQMLQHLHPFPPSFPFVPGYDLVGRITEVGPGVTDRQVGDRVAAMPRHGSWQRYVETPAKTLATVPEEQDAAVAVALITNGVTAWQMLHRVADVRPGDTVLVHGASGGVGTLLTQLAVHHGLRVIGTASPAKHDAVRALGAEPLDYRTPGLPAVVRELAPGGVRAVFDHVGGRGLDDSWAMLADGGTLVSYDSSVAGYRPGQWFRPHVPALRRTVRRWAARHLGLTRGRRMSMYYVKPGKDFNDDLAALHGLVADGVLRPEIAGRHPLDEAAVAVRALLHGSTVGKHVLLP